MIRVKEPDEPIGWWFAEWGLWALCRLQALVMLVLVGKAAFFGGSWDDPRIVEALFLTGAAYGLWSWTYSLRRRAQFVRLSRHAFGQTKAEALLSWSTLDRRGVPQAPFKTHEDEFIHLLRRLINEHAAAGRLGKPFSFELKQ